MSQEAIAEAIGLSVPTLAKHFVLELDRGAAKVRADLLLARYRSAMGGNVSAQTKMLELIGASAAATVLKERETLSAATPRPGKKEIQQQAADAVAEGSKFAPPSGPRLAVNND
ncbi:hypothetical protein [Devosia sp. 1635]|uniref:hypothetical protein n=1 Tax=Devosia sp. 1635 TaxID=2726066 RepID=UPI00156498B0|nr:hypothetical protein [Devosia sp. 1635]